MYGALIANVDADTIMPTGWLTKVHHEFTAHSDLVALSGPFIYYDLPLFHRAVVKTFYVFGYISHLIFRNILHTGAMLQGGNYVLRRDALEKINGYDTSISFYGEDTDIARRISKVGKVKWTFQLPMYTSGRRMQEEGIFRTGATYAINFIWETIFKKPFSTHYTDFR
jgi:cellulose synthase/poly-beta-1,6-N-acetylglucosamine synthase-like glycosyltransferase